MAVRGGAVAVRAVAGLPSRRRAQSSPGLSGLGPEPVLCRAGEFQGPATAAALGFQTAHWGAGAGPPLKVWASGHRLGTALSDLIPLCSHSARPAVSVLRAHQAETFEPLGRPLGWPGRKVSRSWGSWA